MCLDDKVRWYTHTQQLANKLHKICKIRRFLQEPHGVTTQKTPFFLHKICFGILVVKKVSVLETVLTLYHAYFQSLLSYGLIFWGNSANAKLIFKLQKRAIRALMQVPKTTSCKQYFKLLHMLPLPCLYIFEILVYSKCSMCV
jgi:hypothetical protein